MLPFTERFYRDKVPRGVEAILAADIGGTNSNFGIFLFRDSSIQLLFSLRIKSKDIQQFTPVIKDVISYIKKNYDIEIKKAVIAAAGVVSEKREKAKPTNLNFVIDIHDIRSHTSLASVYLVNDFEIIGYGIDKINPKDLVLVNTGNARKHANKVILGAGTGLGKCILYWDQHKNRYMPLASEGGHADFAAQTQEELDLALFIKKKEGFTCNISWEDVLSGYGIQRMYRFFQSRNKKAFSDPSLNENGGPPPDEIFNSRNQDEHSRKTFELYTKLYARCAKNFALDALALSGVYIAGGIAAKNLPLFELPIFMQEFVNCGKQADLLKHVPVYVITDYDVSLYGAAEFMILEPHQAGTGK